MATCDVSVHSWRFKLRVQIIVGTPSLLIELWTHPAW